MKSTPGAHALLMLLALSMSLAGTTQQAAAADAASPTVTRPARLLFVTQSFGFKHGAVNRRSDDLSIAERVVIDWGMGSKLFRADCSQDVPKVLTKENLQNYDIVMFYTTGGRDQWPLDDATLGYLCNDWAKQRGHGFIGVHSAADTLADYEPYWEMLGGSFNGHPWGSGCEVTVVADDPDHPIAKPWGKASKIVDEIYQFKNWQPEKVHVILSLDIGRSVFPKEVKDGLQPPYHIPIAWCKQYGDGRVFHMSLGHNEGVWADPRYRESMLGGIRWVLGKEPGDASPNPKVSAAQVEKGNADVAAKLATYKEP